MIEFLRSIYDQASLAIVGMVGAVLSLRFHPDVNERKTATWFICTGAAIAHFTGEFVAEYFSIGPKHIGTVAFLLGAFGGSLFAAIIRAINAADIWALVKAKLGGGQ